MHEIEENPLLEQVEEEGNLEKSYLNTSYSRYNKNANFNDYNFKNLTTPEDFRFQLVKQLRYLSIPAQDFTIGEYIIKSLDNNGYLTLSAQDIVDEFAFTRYVTLSLEKVNFIIKLIQKFTPPGIGAYNLQECLLIQLERLYNINPRRYKNTKDKEEYANNLELSKKIINDFFLEFANKQYLKIVKKLNLESFEKLRPAIEIIKNLNPKPIRNTYADSINNNAIYPDFIVTKNNDKFSVSSSKNMLPHLKINSIYASLLQNNDFVKKNHNVKKHKGANSDDPETVTQFLKKKTNAATWFIDAIKQRQKTLLNTMNAIVKLQKDFFETEDETNLKPLVLRKVAQEINMDVSTISRVVSNKYVQTDHGIYPLKILFF